MVKYTCSYMCSDSGVIVNDSDNDVMINIINTVDT